MSVFPGKGEEKNGFVRTGRKFRERIDRLLSNLKTPKNMEPYDHGSPVSDSEAHAYVEDFKTQRNLLIDKVLPYVPDYAPQDVKNSVTFHKSKVNAFLFDAALVKALFEGPNPAPYFAVFLGATGTTPVVVIAGLNEGPVPNSLTRLIDAPENGEQPTLLVNVKFPNSDNGPILLDESILR